VLDPAGSWKMLGKFPLRLTEKINRGFGFS
jgi:hypothetical protein